MMVAYVLLICVAQVTGTWPMWGGEPTHQSVQLMKGAMDTTPTIKWKFKIGGGFVGAEFQFSAIADADGDGGMEVVIGGNDHNIYCLDGATGTQKWSFSTGDYVWSSAAVTDADGDGAIEVVIGSQDGKVYCIDGATGTQEWAFATLAIVQSSPAVADVNGDGAMEVVLGGYWDHTVYCLNGADGTQKWAFATGGSVRSSPAVADVDADGGMEVVIGSDDHSIYCLDGATGTQKWTFSTGNRVYSSPAVADADGDGSLEVVIGSWDRHVYCLDGATGTQEWAFATGGYVLWSSPAVADVDGDGSLEVVIGSRDGKVYCIDGATASQEWSYNTGGEVRTPGSLVDIDGDGLFEFLLPSYTDSTLRCLNAENGSLLWQITLASDVHSPFAGDIDGDSCSEIIVGTHGPDANGYSVFALDDAGGASGCGPVYYAVEEGRGSGAMKFRPLGQGLYLFVPHQTQVSLVLYDASGRLIQNLYDGLLRPGGHTFIPNVKAKGVYLAVLRYPGGTKTLKIVR